MLQGKQNQKTNHIVVMNSLLSRQIRTPVSFAHDKRQPRPCKHVPNNLNKRLDLIFKQYKTTSKIIQKKTRVYQTNAAMDSSSEELNCSTIDEPITGDMKIHKMPSTEKRMVWSLVMALALPISLTIAEIYIAGSSRGYGLSSSLPWWFPPLWTLHLALVLYSGVMAASAWLVWNRDSSAVALYVAHLVVSLAWAPLASANPLTGMVPALATIGVVAVCYNRFGKLNRMVRQLILPCLIWAVFLAIVNLRLVYLRL